MRELPSADAAVVWLVRMQARVKPMMPMDDCRRDRRSTESGRPSTPYAAGQPVGSGSRWSAETTQSPEGVNFRGRRSLAPFCQEKITKKEDLSPPNSSCVPTFLLIKVVLKRQFAAFDSLVVCDFFRQTETPWLK